MKLLTVLSAATISAAFVIPEERVLADIDIEHHHQDTEDTFNIQPYWNSFKDTVEDVFDKSRGAFDEAIEAAENAGKSAYEKVHDVGYDVESWLDSNLDSDDRLDVFERPEHPHPPHHGPPDHNPPHHKPPHKEPPHHHGPNQTIYQLISKSKYTTKLTKLIDEDADLVKILNGTAANYTVFAPTDAAFEKIPHHHKPSKDLIKAVLLYHISPELYTAGGVLTTHTIPTLLKSTHLGDGELPQRLAVSVGLRGIAINYYSHVVAINIFATNGVIHGVDSIIIPPPKAIDILQFLPSEFSTLTLGLTKTGLLEKLNTTHYVGGTFFAPSNWAFAKLGPKINGFLFSQYGEKYLNALLKYHIAPKRTLYSDAYYSGTDDKSSELQNNIEGSGHWHVDMPTLLKDHFLSVDVGKLGPFISIRLNGFSRVTVADGVAKDGVIQVVGDVLIPPRNLDGDNELSYWTGEEVSIEEFKERLDPYTQGHQEM